MANNNEYYAQFQENANVKTVIEKVDTSKDRDSNLALLYDTGMNLPGYKEAVNFLKLKFAEKYPVQVGKVFVTKQKMKKVDYMKQIISFVQHTLPSTCLKCDGNYAPFAQADSAIGDVECIKCRIPAHRECYKGDDINRDKGIVFMCQSCLVSVGKEEKEEEKKKDDVDGKHESASDDASDSEDEDSDHKSWTEKKSKRKKKISKSKLVIVTDESSSEENEKKSSKPKKKPQVCPLLIDGNCPHGAAGHQCEYTHIRKCYKFINYGTVDMHKRGCKFGDKCRYLHPTLCNNSVNLKICLNKHCQYAHLKNTQSELNKPNEASYSKRDQHQYRGNGNRGQQNPRGNTSYRGNSPGYNQRQYTSTNQRSPNAWSRNNYRARESDDRDYRPDSYGQSTYVNDSSQSQNQPFLEQALERMEKRMLSQMEMQFRKMHEAYYNEQFPSRW